MNQWYVIKTKPKKEPNVVHQLAKVPYDIFFPRMRTYSSTKPLFPSYLFIRTDFTDRNQLRLVRFTRGVNKILGDQGGPHPIQEEIIETLKKRTSDGSLIEQSLIFKEGDMVRVKKGILQDLVGIIEKNVSNAGRTKILFKWFNKSIRANLKYTDLEKTA